MSDTKPLQDQVALVTGASRGIGQGIALALAQAGAKVAGTATTAEGAERVSAALAPFGGKGFALDVREAARVDAIVGEVEAAFGKSLAILVNNAGITRDNLAMRMKDAEWDEVIDTNLKAVFRLSRAVLRGMIKNRNGRIINITSVVGAAGNPGQMNYAAAKAGVAGMTRSLAREVGSRNVTVNCVAPGFIDTDMTRALSDAQKQGLLTQIPMGRLGSVDDIAGAVVYLASPAAAYVTGTTIHVNGGMFMG